MSSKLHISVDLDDVVLDYVGGVKDAIKKEFGVELKDEDFYQFDLHPILDPIVGRSWWSWMHDRHWIWSTFTAVDGAMGSLEILHKEGYYLELVTSKPDWARYSTFRWLGKWRPRFDRVTIVGPDDVKVEHTDADVLVDDKLANLLPFEREGRIGIMFNRPHNRADTFPRRANNWPEVVSIIRSLDIQKRDSNSWAAGLFDGEGSLGYDRRTGSKDGIQYPRARLQLAMSDEDVVRRFARWANGGTVYIKSTPEGRKTMYVWAATGQQTVMSVLERMLPYLGSRRGTRARRLLAWQKLRGSKVKDRVRRRVRNPNGTFA